MVYSLFKLFLSEVEGVEYGFMTRQGVEVATGCRPSLRPKGSHFKGLLNGLHNQGFEGFEGQMGGLHYILSMQQGMVDKVAGKDGCQVELSTLLGVAGGDLCRALGY